jgi:alpha-1,6-mannosyltransferase
MSDESAAPTPKPLAISLGCLAVGSGALYVATYVPTGPHPWPPSVSLRLVTYPFLFAIYFAAAYLVWRERERARSRLLTGLVLGFALLFRALVLSGPAPLNNDAWRYLWEGRVVLEGLNPYAAPPASPVYDDLRRRLRDAGDVLFDQLPPNLNAVRSVYGPLATGLFVVPNVLPLDRIWTMRLIATLFDVGTVLVLMALLGCLGRAPALALIYAWNPVCLSSFADRAQIDGPMTFFIALAAYLIVRRKPLWGGIAFGAALLIKLAPLYLALPLLRVGRRGFGVALAAMVALGSIPFLLAGSGALSGFRAFSIWWHNTDSIFGLILLLLQPLKGIVSPDAAARAIVMVAAPVYAVWRTLQGDASGPQWLFKACAAIAAAGILLSPVVHPWYTTHLLVFLVFAPNPGLLLLTAATMSWFMRFWRPPAGSLGAPLVARLKPYQDPWRWPAYVPVYALLLWHWAKDRGQKPISNP